jgi:hypothetical protein
MADAPGKRPFWMHQLVEYVLGGVLVASGLQSPTPLVPSVMGGVVMLHAAVTRGSLSAFRLIGRRTHRVGDMVVIGLQLVAAGQPWISVEASTRLIMATIALVHAFVWWQTSYVERVRLPKSGDRSTELGRSAGRLVGRGVNTAKRLGNRDR